MGGGEFPGGMREFTRTYKMQLLGKIGLPFEIDGGVDEMQLGLHFSSKNTGTISIVMEDLS